jgi:hypothetical protein
MATTPYLFIVLFKVGLQFLHNFIKPRVSPQAYNVRSVPLKHLHSDTFWRGWISFGGRSRVVIQTKWDPPKAPFVSKLFTATRLYLIYSKKRTVIMNPITPNSGLYDILTVFNGIERLAIIVGWCLPQT